MSNPNLHLINLDGNTARFTVFQPQLFPSTPTVKVEATPLGEFSSLFSKALEIDHTAKLRLPDTALASEDGIISIQGRITVRFNLHCAVLIEKIISEKEKKLSCSFTPASKDMALFKAAFPLQMYKDGCVLMQISFPCDLKLTGIYTASRFDSDR